jgi:Do/DeqQ family serine protease
MQIKYGFRIILLMVFFVVSSLLDQVIIQAEAHEGHANRESPIVMAARRVSPAVVNISSVISVRKRSNPFSGFELNPFFDSFFKDFFDPYLERQPERSTLGSGVIIDGEKGLIITNAHVVTNAGTIKVTLQDEREFEAEIIGADPDFDLAVLRIRDKAGLPSVPMGNSENLMIGETVIAIGNPFGFSHTVTTGVISALNRSIRTDDRVFHEFIQIDASINPGNSGGPLLNINGELIGINTAIYAKAQGIGFAIPISKARKIISDLITHGEVIEAWIGIIVQNIDAGLARYMGLSSNTGVLVKTVEKGSPASRSGIREGDVIVTLGNRKIVSDDDYQAAMRSHAIGDTLRMEIWRKNTTLKLAVIASKFPTKQAKDLGFRLLGVNVDDITNTNRRRFSITAETGVVISRLDPQSSLAEIGAKIGDVIRRINEVPIRRVADFERAIVKYRHKKSIIVLLQRGEQGYYITIDV